MSWFYCRRVDIFGTVKGDGLTFVFFWGGKFIISYVFSWSIMPSKCKKIGNIIDTYKRASLIKQLIYVGDGDDDKSLFWRRRKEFVIPTPASQSPPKPS